MKNLISRRITNYFLTICFILLIVVFIISIIALSKLMLAEIEPIQRHVESTKNLLEEIEEVEKVTINSTGNSIESNKIKEEDYFQFNYEGFNITSLALKNVNENKSIVTLFLNKPVGESEGKYYVIIKDLNQLKVGDTIAYLSEEGTETGKFISTKDGSIIVGKSKTTTLVEIPKEWLLGKVFYIDETYKDD